MEEKDGDKAMAPEETFPWSIGIFDAHCHPTDTISSLQAIPSMRAKTLTIMATRAQDQHLVAEAANKYGVSTIEAADVDMDWRNDRKIIPSFGWHPWFSHQMYDESLPAYSGSRTFSKEQKASHYQTVLCPSPTDPEFLASLPDPHPFNEFLSRTKSYLERYPLALVGEIGLDRSFRIPYAWLPEDKEKRDDGLTPGGREGRKLSPYRVDMSHQRKVLLAQLRLAGEMQRAVSVHGVQAHGIVYETLSESWKGHELHVPSKKEKKRQEAIRKTHAEPSDHPDGEESNSATNESHTKSKPFPPRACLHSFSGPAETVQQYIHPSVPCEIFFSFSTTINAWSETPGEDGKVEAAVKAVPDDRILVESDMHTAGEEMDGHLENIVRKICQVKGWQLEDGARRLRANWRRFVFGDGREEKVLGSE